MPNPMDLDALVGHLKKARELWSLGQISDEQFVQFCERSATDWALSFVNTCRDPNERDPSWH